MKEAIKFPIIWKFDLILRQVLAFQGWDRGVSRIYLKGLTHEFEVKIVLLKVS